MFCKNCIHYEVCEYVSYTGDSMEEKCKVFKNKADFVEVKGLSPCGVCAYNPPSSFDGKPCALCPATKKRKR